MIYDCFTLFNELDILELRLKTLSAVVDFFVISESNYSHSGKKKPLFFSENRARFTPFLDKIIYIISPDPEEPERAAHDISYRWTLENIQRNATVRHISDRLSDDDLLIISDLDEIPSPSAIREASRILQPVRLRQKLYYYYLNFRCCTTPYWLRGTVILPAKSFNDELSYVNIERGDALVPAVNEGPTATKVRFLQDILLVKNGGWHFSYMGGIRSIMTKLRSIADGLHDSADESYVRHCIDTGNDPYDRGEWYFAEKLNGSFPPAVADYPEMIFRVTPAYMHRVRFRRILAYSKGLVRPLAWKVLPHSFAFWLSRRINAH
jgi:beta-1,4-mannosyl-glycoprotein beta-1,4-N-acetylglucosaminyltransferase